MIFHPKIHTNPHLDTVHLVQLCVMTDLTVTSIRHIKTNAFGGFLFQYALRNSPLFAELVIQGSSEFCQHPDNKVFI